MHIDEMHSKYGTHPKRYCRSCNFLGKPLDVSPVEARGDVKLTCVEDYYSRMRDVCGALTQYLEWNRDWPACGHYIQK